MPIQQLTPPGMLDLHAVLVALTPPALAIAMAGAAAVAGQGRQIRALAWIGLAGALAIQALFLLPSGAAAAFRQPLAHGLVRVGYAPSGCALVLGLWAWWHWRSAALAGRGVTTMGWCLRVALALALPVVAMPLLALGMDGEQQQVWSAPRPWHLQRVLRLVFALAGSALIIAAVAVGANVLVVTTTAGMCLIAISLSTGNPWRIPLLCAGAALLIPW